MSKIQKVSIALTSEQIGALKSAVDAGDFATISEVVREAVRDWQRKNKTYLAEVKRQRLYWERWAAKKARSRKANKKKRRKRKK